jgi:glucose/arabinose dehydrogenase
MTRHVVMMILVMCLSLLQAVARDDLYKIETIPLPEGEESVDGIAFLPDGRLVACLSLSKVYILDLENQDWRLFADGLHTPLGLLPLSNNEVLVTQRPEVTLLRDTDGDGVADEYKTVTDGFGMSGNYGEWCFGPVKDAAGNLFIGLGTGSTSGKVLTSEVRGQYSPIGHQGRMNSAVSFRGWIMRIQSSGKIEPWANGLRQPNGLGFDLDGRLYVPDNQGDYVGSSKLFHIRQGEFYGHAPSLVWRADFEGEPLETPIAILDHLRTPAAIVFPHGDMANSPSQPLCDTTKGLFGPYAGQLFIGEMNINRIIRCMLEEVDGEMQGACTPFVNSPTLQSGNNRLAFHPGDGSLWVGQTLHEPWVGSSGLQRISWTGKLPFDVKMMTLTETGFRLTFTKPVDAASASDPGHYHFERYFYNYQGLYGSKKFGLTPVPVDSVTVAEDGLSVSLTLGLKAWHLYDLTLTGVQSRDGEKPMSPWMVYTLNRLRRDTPRRPVPQPFAKPSWKLPTVPEEGVTSVGGPSYMAFAASEATPLRSRLKEVQAPKDAFVTEIMNDQLVVRLGTAELFRYQVAPMSKPQGGEAFKGSNFFHPVRTPSGFAVTALQPADHLHHFGLWWPWKYIKSGDRKINCWELQNGEGLVVTRELLRHRGGDHALFASRSVYVDRAAPEGAVELISETLDGEVTRPAWGTGYRLDLCIKHEAMGDPIEVPAYRYSGFGYRGPIVWTKHNSTLLTSEEKKRDDSNGTSARWVRVEGEAGNGRKAGVLLMTHPENPRYPESLRTWGANQHDGMVFVNFNTVQTEPLVISKAAPVVRRYSLYVYDGVLSPEECEQIAKSYADSLMLEPSK